MPQAEPIDSLRAALLGRLKREVVDASVAPAVCAGLFSRPSELAAIELRVAAGRAQGRDVAVDTPFDLASLTKPVVALCAARMARAGLLRLEAPLEEALPWTRGTPSGAVPIELLLAHRAGLHAHVELFAPLRWRRTVELGALLQQAARERRPECLGPAPSGGFPPVYSDLGYILLGAALSAAGGAALDELVWHHVTEPLGVAIGSARQWIARSAQFLRSVAPTEHVHFRGGVVCGQVHDENAWALSGHGLSGHAGLFGTLDGVLGLGAALLDCLRGGRPEFLHPTDLEPLLRRRPGGTLRAGFDSAQPSGSSAGDLAGPNTFGHLGFTGTSVWWDPDRNTVTAVLTNRVHPTRERLGIRLVRPWLHDALWRASDVLSGRPSGAPAPTDGKN